MSISSNAPTEKPPTTVLVGHLSDQAALSGILDTLYDLHLLLLAVECLDRPETEWPSRAYASTGPCATFDQHCRRVAPAERGQQRLHHTGVMPIDSF